MSNTNLERYLMLRRFHGDNPPKLGIEILAYVGFPGLESYDTPTDLAVYTLPRHPGPGAELLHPGRGDQDANANGIARHLATTALET